MSSFTDSRLDRCVQEKVMYVPEQTPTSPERPVQVS